MHTIAMAHKVLFVCVGNSSRSQMAEGFAKKLGISCASAGTMPARELSRSAVAVMHEKGIDISQQRPKQIEISRLGEFERLISMGHGVKESSTGLVFQDDWGLDDPVNHPLDVFRQTRDEIERRVQALAREIWEWSNPP